MAKKKDKQRSTKHAHKTKDGDFRNQSSFISTERRQSLEAGENGLLKSKDGGLVLNRRSSLPGSSLPGFNKSLYYAMM